MVSPAGAASALPTTAAVMTRDPCNSMLLGFKHFWSASHNSSHSEKSRNNVLLAHCVICARPEIFARKNNEQLEISSKLTSSPNRLYRR